MINSLNQKPLYGLHRTKTGSPVVIDEAVIKDLFELTGMNRNFVNCRGWDSIKVLVALEGGAVPTIDVQALEHCKAESGFPSYTDPNEGFTLIGTPETVLADGATFMVPVNQGLVFLSIVTVANAPTAIRLYVAGDVRANSSVEGR
jgi:hypothetical protein